jgi:stage III sporulation protein AE
LYQNLGILAKLAVLIVICAVLKNLQSAFLSESVSEIAFYVCYAVIVSVLLVSFSTAVRLGTEIIDGMVGFMVATIPILITMLVSGGSITTGGVFQPVMLMVVEVTATIIKNVFIPLIFLSTILTILSNISEKIQLTRMAGFIRQIGVWGLGIVLTVFIGIVSLQGSMGAVIDGVTSKAAKFAISTFIPVVGKTLSDAADTVIGCTLLIKNAAGAAVMIGIVAICVVPLLKIIALVALYKAAGALFEPISEKRIIVCINDVAGSMLQIFSVTAAVAIMFLISITALISAGNLSAMIR